jgi:DNA mismatch endonuclease (patch repair protein)
VDVFTRKKRSRVMAAIRSKGNLTTELRLIEIFREDKITGWRRNYPLLGRPDFVFPSVKAAIFVDGCFWHGCKRCFRMPTSNTRYWIKKIANNKARDKNVSLRLKRGGWKILRLSECVLKDKSAVQRKLARVLD